MVHLQNLSSSHSQPQHDEEMGRSKGQKWSRHANIIHLTGGSIPNELLMFLVIDFILDAIVMGAIFCSSHLITIPTMFINIKQIHQHVFPILQQISRKSTCADLLQVKKTSVHQHQRNKSKRKLVGGWTTHLKNMLLKLDHSPKKIGVKIPKNLWNHHLVTHLSTPNRQCSALVPPPPT